MSALRICDLYKTYRSGVYALKGINLEVTQGDFFALLGPNGAGKSTTMGIISSLVNKTRGKVFIFDKDIDREFSAAKALMGIVPQEINLNIFEAINDVLIYQAGYYGVPRRIAKERVEQYLRQLDLWGKRRAKVQELSGGMKRRLMIARALVHRPKLLILDEPTAGVDIEIRRSMWTYLRELNQQGTTIILTTHYLEEAENLCKNIAIIDKGLIVASGGIKSLIGKLTMETFLLDLRNPLQIAPKLQNFSCQLLDPMTLAVEVAKDQELNQLFAQLSSQQIMVSSLRNKASRLEEIFMNLVEKNHE